MASAQLLNYLRTNRKRLGLSQDEVAYLLGTGSGGKVCRYERGAREPSLRTALACEAIFQRSVRELFAGIYDEVEKEVATRAKSLARKTDRLQPGMHAARKRETLVKIGGVKRKRLQNS